MRKYLLKRFTFLLISSVILKEVESNNVATLEENHRPKHDGRIEKLYADVDEPVICKDEGFQVDPKDCSIYYRCIKASSGKYVLIRFQCNLGTVYDSEIETCNHPHHTKRPECRSNRPYQFITAPVDKGDVNDVVPPVQELPSPITAQKYSSEENTPTHELISTSSHNLYQEPVALQNSERHVYALFDGVQTTIRPHNSEVTTKTTMFPVKVSSGQSQSTRPASSKNIRYGNECINDGFMGDTEDCRKFYRCVKNARGGFMKYEFMCSEPTIWDDDLQNCNHHWAVRRRRCASGNYFDDKISNYGEKYINKNNNDKEVDSSGYILHMTQTPIQVSLTLSTPNQIHYGDRINHDKVWPNDNNYMNIENANSHKTTISPVIEKQTHYTLHHQEPVTASTYSWHEVSHDLVYSTNYPINKAINNKCLQSGFMSDLNDCRKFYRCVENGKGSYTRHEFLCGEGTAWDKNLESCNHIWLVKDCKEKHISNSFTYDKSDSKSTIHTINPLNITTENTPYAGYNNYQQKQSTISQPASTSALPEATVISLQPLESHENEGTCKSVGYKGSKVNCRRFYRCIKNKIGGFTKYEYLCDEGTVWDPNIEACNHANLVKHCGANLTDESTVNSASTESTVITTISFVQTSVQSNNGNSDIGYNSHSYEVSTQKTKTTIKDKFNTENKCENNGFMADSNDCRKFYRCVHNENGGFTRYEYLCGEGTLWDVNINACNHFWAVEKCGNNIPNNFNESIPLESPPLESVENVNGVHMNEIENDITRTTERTTTFDFFNKTTDGLNKGHVCSSSGFIGDDNDCKKFYRCVSNGDGNYQQYEFNCGEGTVWDPEIESCNHAWAVKKCGGKKKQHELSTSSLTTILPLNDTTYTTKSYHQTDTFVQNTLSSSTEKIQHTGSTQECEASGFIADKNDCTIFYRCVENSQGGFDRFRFSCGDGTAWDSSVQACNHALSVAECKSINSKPSLSTEIITINENMTSTTDFSQSSNEGGYKENEFTSTTTKFETSNICSVEGFYGDKNDCKKFYRCVSNENGLFHKYEFSCGEGTVWDQNVQACNHAPSSSITCIIPTTSANESFTQMTVSTENYSITDFSPTKVQSDLTPNLNNSCNAEGYYPDINDCKKFYRCVSNGEGGYVKYDFICGEGTIWVQKILACDHDDDKTTCGMDITAATESHTSITKSTTLNDITSVHTEFPSTITTESSVEISTLYHNECNSEGYFADYRDCRRFYRCVQNDGGVYIKYDYLCGEGTAWDIDIQSCNHLINVKRCQSTNDQIQSTTVAHTKQPEIHTTKKVITTTMSSSRPESTSEYATTLSSTTQHVAMTNTSNNNCYRDGFFGNKEDCQKFYRCVDNGKGGFTKYDFICGDGTIWDQDIIACNHPRDVENSSCDNQTTNSASTTTTHSTVQSTTSMSSTTTHSTIQSTTSMSSTNKSPTSPKPVQSTISSSEYTTLGSSKHPIEASSTNPKNETITCTKAGFYPNPKDCKKFYRCVDWNGDGKKFSIFHFECGEGTIWDPSLDTCNYEESVYPPRNCNRSEEQNNTTISEATTISVQANSTSSISAETTMQTTQSKEESTTESTTLKQTTNSETTIMPSTTEGQSTVQQITTSIQTSSTSSTPTHTSAPTSEQTTNLQSTTEPFTTAITSELSTATQETTSAKTTTPTEQTTVTTSNDKTTTTTELSTSVTEQQTSTVEQSSTEKSTEQATSQTTSSYTQESTSKEDTTTQGSTTEQTASSGLTTEKQNASTTEESTTMTAGSTTESSQETNTQENSVTNNCPETESGQYLYVCPTSFKRHPKYCNLFYQCIEDNDNHELKIAVFNCPNGTIYDETKIQCVEESKTEMKCQGTIAKNRRIKRLNVEKKETISVSENKYGCPGVGHYPFEKNEQCSPALLKCEISISGKLQGLVYRCPDNYIYWSVSRKCEPISAMTDCKHSSNQWTGRSEIPVERKNVSH
ncbi:serine-rich adhesin for platelets-like [Battus philenor]|uniref:serine-rich adhesin for platelets-like n=1 Tax=Battus philenor TaxID=42288 RepID=UPI0035CF1CBA